MESNHSPVSPDLDKRAGVEPAFPVKTFGLGPRGPVILALFACYFTALAATASAGFVRVLSGIETRPYFASTLGGVGTLVIPSPWYSAPSRRGPEPEPLKLCPPFLGRSRLSRTRPLLNADAFLRAIASHRIPRDMIHIQTGST